MKSHVISMNSALVLTLLLAACDSAAPGPQAWIDAPLDHATLPLKTLTIITHSSDAEGVAGFEFYANEQSILSAATLEHKRLESMEIQWTPPGPGTYLIGVRGVNNRGISGAIATSLVTFSGAVTITSPPEPITSRTVTVTLTATRTATSTPVTPAPPSVPSVTAKLDANCREGPGTVYEVYGSLLKGQEAALKARLADNSWLMIALAGRSRNCWIAASTVNVSGNLDLVELAAAPAEPPPSEGEPPAVDILPPDEIDASPPVIANIDVDPTAIITEGGGCPSYPRTTTVAAAVGDASGLSEVTAYWHIGSVESGAAPLTLGGFAYWTTIGPVHNAGTMEIYIYAQDTIGYSSQSGKLYVTVQDCPG